MPGFGLLLVLALITATFGLTVFFGAPYVPSQKKFVRRALTTLYPLSEDDVLVDIGSGDGLILRVAAEKGARAIGYEINPVLVFISRLLIGHKYGRRTTVLWRNFWTQSLPDETTVVYAFSVSRDAKKLSRKMQREADRLGRSLSLLCFGPSLKDRQPDEIFEAYALYRFHPVQDGVAQV